MGEKRGYEAREMTSIPWPPRLGKSKVAIPNTTLLTAAVVAVHPIHHGRANVKVLPILGWVVEPQPGNIPAYYGGPILPIHLVDIHFIGIPLPDGQISYGQVVFESIEEFARYADDIYHRKVKSDA